MNTFQTMLSTKSSCKITPTVYHLYFLIKIVICIIYEVHIYRESINMYA